MIVQYYTGNYPWWDDNSLSKPSKTLFTNSFENQTSLWTTINNPVVLNLTYNSAVLQFSGNNQPNNNNTYYRISLDSSTYYYFFTDTIEFDNLSSIPTVTVNLRLDKWGTCVSNLASDFDAWTTQVLATNKEVNLYDYWTKAYNNLSSYTFLKKVYPNLSDIELIKYNDSQYVFNEQQNNLNNEAINNNGYNYYYYKINYLVTAYNNTETTSTTYNKLEGNYRDYYTVKQTTNNNTTLNITTLLPDWIAGQSATNLLPFVCFSPVVDNVQSKDYFDFNGKDNYWITKWNFPLLLSLSTDKDIGLIQLPFCLTNKGLNSMMEGLATGNYWLGNGGSAIFTFSSGGGWNVSTVNQDNTPAFLTYFVDPNGLTIDSFYLTDSTNIPFNWTISSYIQKDGFNNAIASEPWSFNMGAYVLEPFFIMYPMLYNYYSWNISYMGQTVSYTSKYVNNIFNLTPFNINSQTNPLPLKTVFSANYPNLSLNVYAQDNVINSCNQPIGQINLTTSQLPNTTNPNATFQTNEAKIINNAATLKNLDMSKAALGYLGGLGLNSLLNPFSLITSAVTTGLDIDSININYSNSFGKAKFNELGHSNTLQTAGDNLGQPDNLLTYYCLVPALNDIQNIIGQVDKYGYPYNQWDKFNNLFGNYYHNYVKLSQNADLVIYQNAPKLIKDWQTYLINQFINGVVIWSNLMPDGSINFVDSWQLYNDCIENKENFGNIQQWDVNYHANFKAGHIASTLTRIELTQIQQPQPKPQILNLTPVDITPAEEPKTKPKWKKL